jgi:hypothetical protein
MFGRGAHPFNTVRHTQGLEPRRDLMGLNEMPNHHKTMALRSNGAHVLGLC